MQDQFLNFERQLEEETKLRRSAEDVRTSTAQYVFHPLYELSLRDSISRLEKTLIAEIKRRAEANQALRDMFETQIIEVQEKLEEAFVDKLGRVEIALNGMSDRLSLVERDFAVERDRYIRDIEDKNALVARDINQLEKAFETDRVNRAEREAGMIRRLTEFETRADNRIEQNRLVLDNYKNSNKFENFVLEEIASIKNSIIVETQNRENSDDDLINALNHYTKALQDALRLINTIN
jgi:hypothetical protein